MLATDVVVVGAGYAGCYAIAGLRRARVDVVAVDPTGTMDMLPRLAAVAGHADAATDAAIELTQLFPHLKIVRGKMKRFRKGVVTTEAGHRVRGRVTIITAGAQPTEPTIAGLANAFQLRTAADALRLRAAVGEAEDVVIVGGGATGVQLAGALSNSGVANAILVDSASRLLPEFHESLGSHAKDLLSARGVRIELDAAVESIQPNGVVLEDGTELIGLPVWAGGFRATMDAFKVGPTTEGRLNIGDDLRVEGTKDVLAAGDAAAHLDSKGNLRPMAAQTAVQAGSGAAKNAVRMLRGQPTASVAMRDLGWVVDLTGGRGVAQVGPFRFATSGLDRIPPYLHDFIDAKTLYEVGGVKAVKRYSPGRQTTPPEGLDLEFLQHYLG